MHHQTDRRDRSTRREFLLLSGAALATARPAFADSQKPKIGYLSWFPDSMKDDLERFREGMEKVGYAREDYVLEGYITGGNPQLTRDLAQKLLEEPVDVFVVVATPAIHIVKAATQTTQIVMYTANALATGLVPSLSRPGGNLTGVSLLLTDMAGKRMELLRQIDTSLHTAAFLGSTKDPNTVNFVNETQRAADSLGIKLVVKLVDGPQALKPSIFDAMKAEGSQAIIAQPIFIGYQKEIVAMAMRDQLPVISDWSTFAKAGALFTYGAKQEAGMRRTAYYVDRILKGAKPADLPIEQPTEFELIVNAKTAKLLRLNVPQSLLTLADDVIE